MHAASEQPTPLLTGDGSHSLCDSRTGETYHSSFGAVQESQHIFIEQGLRFLPKKEITILEVGFGTGLNAWLSLLEGRNSGLTIHYHSLEKYPLSPELTNQLNYSGPTDRDLFRLLHSCAWNREVAITPDFYLTKTECDFTQYKADRMFDCIYFDAFSPDRQPEMWTEERFRHLAGHCNNQAVITTYCSKGDVRRAMIAAGFEVEKLQGPPGKRHILRGIKK